MRICIYYSDCSDCSGCGDCARCSFVDARRSVLAAAARCGTHCCPAALWSSSRLGRSSSSLLASAAWSGGGGGGARRSAGPRGAACCCRAMPRSGSASSSSLTSSGATSCGIPGSASCSPPSFSTAPQSSLTAGAAWHAERGEGLDRASGGASKLEPLLPDVSRRWDGPRFGEHGDAERDRTRGCAGERLRDGDVGHTRALDGAADLASFLGASTRRPQPADAAERETLLPIGTR